MINIQITKEEREAGIVQLAARLTALKELAKNRKDYDGMEEIVSAIKPIQSLFNKILNAEEEK